MSGESKWTFLFQRHREWKPTALEKMIDNITKHQPNTNQNYKEISPHNCDREC